MTQSFKHVAWIVLAIGVAAFLNLGTPRLWDIDEPRNATCAAEMFSRGDWIVPTFNGELRTDKPILLYWCMMPAYMLLGVNEFAARLTSAIFGVGTVLLTYRLGRRLFGPGAALWAALLLSSSVMFIAASRWATPDSLLIFFSTLALLFFVEGSFAADAASVDGIVGLPAHWSSYLKMYAAMSMAVLAKGPVGLVLPMAIVGLYLLVLNPVPVPKWHKTKGGLDAARQAVAISARWLVRTFWPARVARFAWQLRPLTMLGVVAVVALPWYVAVGIRTGGEWPSQFLWKHNVGRFAAPMEGHSGLPFFHVLSMAYGFFPASVFLVPVGILAVRRLRSDDASRRGYLLAICWATVYLLVFSAAATKLPNYVTPIFPALALMTGGLFHEWIMRPDRISRFWQSAALAVFGLVGLGLAVGVPLLARYFLPGEGILGLLGVVPILGAVVCWALAARGDNRSAAVVFVASATLFTTALFAWGRVCADRFQNAVPIASTIERISPRAHRIATYAVLQPSWVYYAREPIIELNEEQFEAAVRLFDERSPPTFLITSASQLANLRPRLPAEVRELGRFPRFLPFLQNGEIVILGRPQSEPQGAERTAAMSDFSRLR